jgi:hypothetical protein
MSWDRERELNQQRDLVDCPVLLIQQLERLNPSLFTRDFFLVPSLEIFGHKLFQQESLVERRIWVDHSGVEVLLDVLDRRLDFLLPVFQAPVSRKGTPFANPN